VVVLYGTVAVTTYISTLHAGLENLFLEKFVGLVVVEIAQ